MASNICQARCPPRHPTHHEPPSLEISGILRRDEQHLPGPATATFSTRILNTRLLRDTWHPMTWRAISTTALHPGDFTPVCTSELGAVAKLLPEFDARGVLVAALSCNGVAGTNQDCPPRHPTHSRLYERIFQPSSTVLSYLASYEVASIIFGALRCGISPGLDQGYRGHGGAVQIETSWNLCWKRLESAIETQICGHCFQTLAFSFNLRPYTTGFAGGKKVTYPIVVGPARYVSPRHGTPFDSTNQSLKCVEGYCEQRLAGPTWWRTSPGRSLRSGV